MPHFFFLGLHRISLNISSHVRQSYLIYPKLVECFVFSNRSTLTVTWILACCSVLRPSPQKPPAPQLPHTSLRSELNCTGSRCISVVQLWNLKPVRSEFPCTRDTLRRWRGDTAAFKFTLLGISHIFFSVFNLHAIYMIKIQLHFNEPLSIQLSNAFCISPAEWWRLASCRQSTLKLNDVSWLDSGFLWPWILINSRQFLLCRCVCPFSASWRSDGERRSVRDQNREKDSHHRRCRHRSRWGLLEVFSFYMTSREFLTILTPPPPPQ